MAQLLMMISDISEENKLFCLVWVNGAQGENKKNFSMEKLSIVLIIASLHLPEIQQDWLLGLTLLNDRRLL